MPTEQRPEALTALAGSDLVPKDHPRIHFRGEIDSLQALVVVTQCELEERGAHPRLIRDLEETLELLRQVTRSEVLDETLPPQTLFGLSPEELRAQSHDPKGHFGVEPMTLPCRSMGLVYARLNLLRTEARAAERAAAAAFYPQPTPAQADILRAMNRLSSAYHVLMCRYLAGQYSA